MILCTAQMNEQHPRSYEAVSDRCPRQRLETALDLHMAFSQHIQGGSHSGTHLQSWVQLQEVVLLALEAVQELDSSCPNIAYAASKCSSAGLHFL